MNPKVSVFLEIFLVGLGLVGLWFFLSWSTVYAEVDRLELEELKKEVGLAEIEFKKINREIVDLKILQRGLEHDLENQKTLLENIKEDSKTDWNAIPKIEQIERSITNLEIQIEENNKILLELEEERNSFADKALLLQDQYNNDFEQFKIQNTLIQQAIPN
jgi:chromosome segregation ATPase